MELNASLLSKDQWIIPDWKIGDVANRDQEIPIRLRIKPVIGSVFSGALLELDKLSRQGFVERQHKLRDKLIRNHVLEVSGLDIRIGDDSVVSPKNGKELIEALGSFDGGTMQAILDDTLNILTSAVRIDESLAEKFASRST